MKPCTVCGQQADKMTGNKCTKCYNRDRNARYHANRKPRKQVIVDFAAGFVTVQMPLTDGRGAAVLARVDDWKQLGYEIKVKE